MLRKLIIWVIAPILTLIWLVAVLIVITLRTDAGRNTVLGYALPLLEESTGLKAQYENVGGPWPNRLIFRGLVLSDDQGVWFSADYVAIDWSPFRLLSNRLMFPKAEIDNGYLRRTPVIRGEESTGKPSKPGHPFSLRIRTLIAKRFHLGRDLLDQELTADLRGRVTLERWHDIKVNLDADVDTPGDFSPHLRELLGAGLKLRATIEGNIHQSLAISGLDAQTRDGRLSLNGAGDYVIHTHVLDSDVSATLAPELARWITSDLATKSPIALKARLFGPFRDLSIKAEAAFKDASFAGTELPPLTANGDIVLTPENVAGPVAITFMKAGKPTGKAAALLDYEMSGHVKLAKLSLDYGSANVTGALDIVTDPATSGTASFAATIPDLSALPVDLPAKGDLKANGQVRFDKGAMSLDATAASDHLVVSGVDVKTLAAKLKGPLTSVNIAATAGAIAPPAVGTFGNADISATLGLAAETTTIRFAKLTADYGGNKLSLVKPATLAIAQDRLALDTLDVKWGEDGRFTGMAERNGEDLRLSLKIAGFNPPQGPARIDGVIDVDTKRAAKPGTLALSLVPTGELKSKVKVNIGGKWDKKRLSLVASFEGVEEDAAFRHLAPATFSMPLALAPGKGLSISTEGPIDGKVVYGGPIAPFIALVPMPQQTLSGTANINITVAGTLDDPVFAGSAALKDGKYQNIRRGVVLDHLIINGKVDHSATGYVFDADLSASDGRKHADGEVPIKAKSEMSLGKGKPKLTASLDLVHAQLVHLATTTGIASGHLEVGGTVPDLKATGTLNIESLDVNIPDAMPADIVQIKVVPVDENGNPIAPEELPVEKDPYSLALDCSVIATGNINIKGRGLDSEWRANLHIGGTKDDPQISGAANLVRGRFDFSGRRFELTRGTIGFAPTNSFDPTLSISAQYTDTANNLDMINVTGPASQPKITMTSDPPQAQEDVMAMVLFGKQAKELSAFEAVQTANAVAKLTGTGLPGMGGMGILDRARSTLGLDLLNVSLGAQGSVSVGKYIQKNIYVEATQGLAGQPGTVSVNVDISKSLSVKTNVGQDSTGSAGIFWKKDY